MRKLANLAAISVLSCVCLIGMPAGAGAAYPDHTVTIVVPVGPGGGTDRLARLVARGLSKQWKQPVIIENRPGADGEIAYDSVAEAPPDGYRLAFVIQTFTVLPSQHKALPYDPVKSFAPIALLYQQPDVLMVNATFPAKTLKDLIARAKSDPNHMNYGSSGVGSDIFLAMEQLENIAGFKMVHVAYQGGAGQAQAALLGNEIQALFQPISGILGQVKAGKMRALAVTGEARNPLLPDVPTLAEATGLSGFGFENSGTWDGMSAPAGTPPAILKKLHDDIATAVNAPDARRITDAQGTVVVMSSPAVYGDMLRQDIPEVAKLMTSFKPK